MVELGDLGVLLLDKRTIGGTCFIDRYVPHHTEDRLQF
jgi:hypothetical protein